MTRYLIFGAGAVGTLLGGLLAKAGNSVTFIGRKWNIEGIRQDGIRISGIWGDHDIPPQPAYEAAGDIPTDQREIDQIIITVKAFDTEKATQSCLPVIQDASLVISCQNGFGNNQIIADRIGWRRTLGARFITGVEITAPGVVQVTVHADSVRLGHYRREFPMEQIESIARTLREAGIPTEATDQLEQYVWAKILYNAALNPLGALLGVTYGELADNQETRSIMNRIIEEAFAVTGKCGIEQFWPDADAYKDAFYNQMLPPTAAHFPSMLRDLERGRQTEINALNGAISQLGEKANVSTSVNDTIASLIHFREKLRDT
ncbi:MAG: 2-dehydropantoate 2-reductase [Candidatus Omnitrophica bacterium]|nr:2-dehydropantoate 2-reductase [Candidatus Omnitrophota bacterium]